MLGRRRPALLGASLFVLSLACGPRGATTVAPGPAAHDTVATHDAAPVATPKIAKVSDDPIVQRIVELGTTDSHVDEHLQHLTKVIGPRLTGSHALMEAERWTRSKFASFGLDARIERWGEVPVGFDRGPWSGGMVAPVATPYVFTTRAWTPGAFGPVRGLAIAYPDSAKQVTADPKRFAGAWVVVPERKPEARPSEAVTKAIDAALHAANVAGFVERARDPARVLVHTSGSYEVDWAALPADPRVILRGDQHDDLTARMAKGEGVELEFSIDNRFFKGPVPQHNVVADLVGSELPDEIVIVGGHLDSWDGAEGAVDNGTGCSTTLEAARLLVAAGAKPKRTIRFMLWSGEEQGLLGSKAYVDAHPELVERTQIVLVHDGGTNFLSGLEVTPEMAKDMQQVFAPVMKLDDAMPFGLWYADSLRKGGSDHSPFIDKGIPGFFWRQSGRADYDHSHHTQFDTLDFAIPEYQKHSAMVVAIAALGFANLDHRLDRTDSASLPRRELGVEFDGTRAKSISKGGRAAKAGMRVGDEVLEVDGKAGSRWELFRAIQSTGQRKQVAVLRKGKRIELTFDYPGDPADAERDARRDRRKQRFGELDYDKPFAGREWVAPTKPGAAAQP